MSALSYCVSPHQNTALHIAARLGHVAAVKLMLARGAELILNKNDTSFLHEALQNGKKDVVNALIDSDRYVININSCRVNRVTDSELCVQVINHVSSCFCIDPAFKASICR